MTATLARIAAQVSARACIYLWRAPPAPHPRPPAPLLQEGPRGLFKGFTLNLVKGPVAVGVSLSTYDWLKVALGLGRAAGLE